jgi:hypothetical protein
MNNILWKLSLGAISHGFYYDIWCKVNMGWLRKLFLYRQCNCPKDVCYPMGKDGPQIKL